MGVVFDRAFFNGNEALPPLACWYIIYQIRDKYACNILIVKRCRYRGATGRHFNIRHLIFLFLFSFVSSRVTRVRNIVQRRNKHKIVSFYFQRCLFINIRCKSLAVDDFNLMRGRHFIVGKYFYPSRITS